jgi:hypothetical protein
VDVTVLRQAVARALPPSKLLSCSLKLFKYVSFRIELYCISVSDN